MLPEVTLSPACAAEGSSALGWKLLVPERCLWCVLVASDVPGLESGGAGSAERLQLPVLQGARRVFCS